MNKLGGVLLVCALSVSAWAAAPAISGISPQIGAASGGKPVTIIGTDLESASSVTFGGSAGAITGNTPTQIIVLTPFHAAGPVDVVVTTPGGSDTAVNGYTFVPAPTIGAVTPGTGLPGGGSSVTITGMNLTGASAVTFGGTAAQVFSVVDATTITVTTPSHAGGAVDVVVTTPGGDGTASGAFVYAAPPVVNLISPSQGPLGGGQTVTINGMNLLGTTSVTFGGVSATFGPVTDTQILATTPSNSAGLVNVVVTNSAGSAMSGYTYGTFPSITSVVPSVGPAAGGQIVTISGANLDNANIVSFGSGSGAITGNTATQITVITPSQAPGLVAVSVSSATGSGFLPNAYRFNAAPEIATGPTVTPAAPTVGSPVTVSLTITDPENDVVTVTYDWDDGVTNPSSQHTYATAGTYDVLITLSDGINTVMQTVPVTVIDTIPFNATGLLIKLNFTKAGSDTISLGGALPLPNGTSVAGTTVVLDVGGVVHSYTLDATGQSSDPSGSFGINAAASGFPFTASLQGTLAAVLASVGLTNISVKALVVSVPVSVTLKGQTYKTVVLGLYDALINKSGEFRFGKVGAAPNPPPALTITAFSALPNPIAANTPVTFTATLSNVGNSDDLSATLDFGDGVATPFTATGSGALASLKLGIAQTYNADGAYTATLNVDGSTGSASATAFVIVGNSTSINSANGIAVTEQIVPGDGSAEVTLSINVGKIPGATTATTVFEDAIGQPRGATNRDPSGIDGLIVARTFSQAGLYRATSIAKDGSGNEKGKARKTFGVSLRALGDSGAPQNPPSSVVTSSAFTGKFLFKSDHPDKVGFTGSFFLPQGFNPATPGGNSFEMGIGNVLDATTVDAKGKAALPTARMRIKKLKLSFPKFAGGVAVGGEKAKISLGISAADLDAAGLDTEGVTATLRADEKGRKSVPRFIQINLLINGVAYEALAPVLYALSANGESGAIKGRR